MCIEFVCCVFKRFLKRSTCFRKKKICGINHVVKKNRTCHIIFSSSNMSHPNRVPPLFEWRRKCCPRSNLHTTPSLICIRGRFISVLHTICIQHHTLITIFWAHTITCFWWYTIMKRTHWAPNNTEAWAKNNNILIRHKKTGYVLICIYEKYAASYLLK